MTTIEKLDYEEYLPMIDQLVRTQCARRGISKHLDEAMQICRIIAWDTWQDYDPTRGAAFKSVVYRAIAGEVAKVARNPITGDRKNKMLQTHYMSELQEHCKDTDVEDLFGSNGVCYKPPQETLLLVHELLSRLSSDDQELITSWMADEDISEIASRLSVTKATIHTRVNKIVARLRPLAMSSKEFFSYEKTHPKKQKKN